MLLALAIAVCVLACLDDGFLSLLHRRALHAAVTLRERTNGFDASVPMDTTFDSHGLQIREEKCEGAFVRRMHEFRAIQALLALALLHEEVVAAVAVESQFSASGTTDTLLRAAVGLELWHEPDDLSGSTEKSKGK